MGFVVHAGMLKRVNVWGVWFKSVSVSALDHPLELSKALLHRNRTSRYPLIRRDALVGLIGEK